ncbi:hypothetical protein LINGRAHAP2_LOCUS34224 [Linum grandiflorum]
MNTSQLVDKQIMDLTSSSSPSSISQPQSLSPKSNSTGGGGKDFINLMNHPKDNHDDQHANYGAGTSENGIRKEEILPSYDFHLIRPVAGGDSTAGARSWNSADAKSSSLAMSGSPARHYGSLDSIEPSKDVLEKDRSISDSAILSEIDKTMKRHTDNMLIVLEGVSSRLIQLESRTRHLESSVDDLKVSVGNNHGSADGKMRQLENILREVQTGVQAVKDKQEVLETQIQVSKLQVSKSDQQQPPPQNTFQVDAVQQAASASAPPQAHQQQHAPVNFPQSIPSVPVPHPTVASSPQQNYQPVTSHPNQYAPAAPLPPNYAPAAAAQTQEPSNPQYQVPQPSPAAPPHQLYQPIPQSPCPQQAQMPQPPPQSQLQQPSASHHSEEASSYLASQSYPPSLRHPTSQPPNGPLPPQQYYGAPSSPFEPPPSIRPSSGFSAGYSPPSGAMEPLYPYGGSSTMKPPQQLQSGSGSGYPQLPTARMLPQASAVRPAAGGAGSGSSSANRVPVDDVIDKVATMGFPRDQVHEAVRRLTENGQAVDLNVVLDKLMNGGGYYGR